MNQKKYLKYQVVDSTTLELQEDGKKGDRINLLDVTEVDTKEVLEALQLEKDNIIQSKINQAKLGWEKENEALLKSLEDNYNQKLKLSLVEAERKLQEKVRDIEELKIKHESELSLSKTKLEAEIESLKQLEKTKEQAFELQLSQVKKEEEIALKAQKLQLDEEKLNELKKLDKVIKDLQEKISILEREQTSNIKVIGEDLENWCYNQFMEAKLHGFDYATLEKTNQTIQKTKPDFIFTVYTSVKNRKISQIVMDMKSESLTAKNSKKNKDHYDKLDKDRNNHGMEGSYALLVSELEKDNPNIIEKVQGYEKMYMVRPAYFMLFLSLFYSLSMKLERIELEKIKFKDQEEILTEFDNLKSTIIDNNLRHLKNRLAEAIESVKTIKKEALDLETRTLRLVKEYADSVEKELIEFKIHEIIQKINNLE